MNIQPIVLLCVVQKSKRNDFSYLDFFVPLDGHSRGDKWLLTPSSNQNNNFRWNEAKHSSDPPTVNLHAISKHPWGLEHSPSICNLLVKVSVQNSPLKCFGQQTNSTPENTEIPHGNKMAKLLICMPRSWHAAAPVWFHRANGQHRDALWMWSNKQPSGTSRASDWNGPSMILEMC